MDNTAGGDVANPRDEAPAAQPAKTQPKADVDFWLLDYVTAYDHNLTCPICHCPFVEGVRLDCDHTFCRQCLAGAIQAQTSSRKTCPSCRSRADTSKVNPVPRFIRQMIDDLIVHCPKHEAGCKVELRREDVQGHADRYCDYTELPCPASDCDLLIPRRLLNDKCMHVQQVCESCSEEVMVKDIEEHAAKRCSANYTECPHCKQTHPVSDSDKHTATCQEMTLPCSAQSVGCTTQLPRKYMDDHESGCVLVSLLPTLNAMGRKIEDQQATINTLRRKNDILEGGITSMQELLASGSFPIENATATSSAKHAASETARSVSDALREPSEAPFDSATHHLLSLHETLREELERLGASVGDVDSRLTMTMINDNLRIREDMAHQNAAINSLRMQLQWLTQARLRAQSQAAAGPAAVGGPPSAQGPPRRLSDTTRQDTKL